MHRFTRVVGPLCALVVGAGVLAASSTPAALASAPNPYAQHVVGTSNKGLAERMVEVGPGDGDLLGLTAGNGTTGGTKGGGSISIPTFDGGCTTGTFCELLTINPAQGCLETDLSMCTQQTWCTSNTRDKCTTNPTCTSSPKCTNTKGCTDAGMCTNANGCTGGTNCTISSGCTQGASCTNGTWCTDDAGTCTGGANCTSGTGCTGGSGCTGGAGCTKDAQCTKGATCTKGTSCTKGAVCTKGSSCPTVSTPGGTGGGVAALGDLGRPGVGTPMDDPHFAPSASLASMGWLLLLLIPTFLRRR